MHNFATLTCAAALIGIAGCSSTTPHWDAQFGDTTRSLMASQVINPEATFNTDPVEGMDGKAARAAMGEYHKTHAQPQVDSQFFTIDVGSNSR